MSHSCCLQGFNFPSDVTASLSSYRLLVVLDCFVSCLKHTSSSLLLYFFVFSNSSALCLFGFYFCHCVMSNSCGPNSSTPKRDIQSLPSQLVTNRHFVMPPSVFIQTGRVPLASLANAQNLASLYFSLGKIKNHTFSLRELVATPGFKSCNLWSPG